MSLTRLEKQIEFITEADKLKRVLRRSYITGGSRNENTAEHSWHVGLMAMILAEHSDKKIDAVKVMKMLILHDLVEIDAGDTYVYNTEANLDKFDRETEAADRIFGLLPEEQGRALRQLWDEFEALETPEAQFAKAIDRLMPLIHNYCTKGKSWKEHGIRKEQVYKHQVFISEISFTLWKYAEEIINNSVAKGYLDE